MAPAATRTAPQRPRAAADAAQLARILEHERRTGSNDRAVIGGLDRLLDRLAKTEPAAAVLVASLPAGGYGALTPADRDRWLAEQADNAGGGQRPATRARGSAAAAARREPAAGTPASSAPEHEQQASLDMPLGAAGLSLNARAVERFATLGIDSVRGLLTSLLPFRYHDISNPVPIQQLVEGEDQAVNGTLVSVRAVRFRGGQRGACEAEISDATGATLHLTWFNQPWLASSLRPGVRIAVAGKVSERRRRLTMANPEFYIADSEDDHGRLVPVYHSTRGLAQPLLRRTVQAALERFAGELEDDPLPAALIEAHDLPGFAEAVRGVHNPLNHAAAKRADQRLAFEEMLALQLAVVRRKRRAEGSSRAPAIEEPDTINGFIASLPFTLTAGQQQALADISADIALRSPSGRLLQGDVGSGKTVVALAAMLACANSGRQAVLMAPTEVLAEQHFRTICSLLNASRSTLSFGLANLPFMSRNVRAVLLTGSRNAAQRRNALAAIKNGSAGIAVGTHALIQEQVQFARLGLAVVDEQHRFGVQQRTALRRGGKSEESPHLLVMTATPIPRSLALTIYGDLDVTTINEVPPGRPQIVTRQLGQGSRGEAFARIRDEITAGRQAFVICPLVEGSQAVAARAATEEFERLQGEEFPDLAGRIELLHGRMSSAEKDAAMVRFAQGEADILVSTAVVEVGIDVPNATVMAIEGADRFGIAQLHQFRERVGRGTHQSYCFLLSDNASEEAGERLSLVERNSNGFDLAQADLELRGPGDLFGVKQAGASTLRSSSLLDVRLIEMTRREAERILGDDPELEDMAHAGLRVLGERAEQGILGEAH